MPQYCACCGRQIVDYPANEEHIVGGGRVVPMGPTLGVACHMCAQDLDENGNFPNEPGYKDKRRVP